MLASLSLLLVCVALGGAGVLLVVNATVVGSLLGIVCGLGVIGLACYIYATKEVV